MLEADPKEDPQIGTHGYVYRYRIGVDFEDCADDPEHRANAGEVEKFMSEEGE